MEDWRPALQVAAVGVTVAALLELVLPARRETTQERVAHCLVAGGVAAAYAQLVPAHSWGARSGAAFGQMGLMRAVQARVGMAPGLKLAAWGALTGWSLRRLARRQWITAA